jgi:hypothetical protein
MKRGLYRDTHLFDGLNRQALYVYSFLELIIARKCYSTEMLATKKLIIRYFYSDAVCVKRNFGTKVSYFINLSLTEIESYFIGRKAKKYVDLLI